MSQELSRREELKAVRGKKEYYAPIAPTPSIVTPESIAWSSTLMESMRQKLGLPRYPQPAPSPAPSPTPSRTETRTPVPTTPTNAKITFIGASPRPSLSPLTKHKAGATFYLEQLEEQRKRRLEKYKVAEKPEAQPEAKPVVLTIPATLKFGDYEVKTVHVVVGVSLAVIVIALLVFT